MTQGNEQSFIPSLEPWLARHAPGSAGPLQIKKFPGGQSNPTYLLTTPQRSYVMRAKPGPAANLLPSAHAVDREHRVMSALAETDVPVPRTHVLCEDESVIGRAFFVMEHVDGRILWKPSLPEMTPAGRGEIFDEMNRVIAALHAVDPSKVGLADYGKPANFLERQIGRWIKQYQLAATETIEEMDALIAWLPAHRPASRCRPCWSMATSSSTT
jgi:aminoglycoside phosphotransferase (APT) family kinase protein